MGHCAASLGEKQGAGRMVPGKGSPVERKVSPAGSDERIFVARATRRRNDLSGGLANAVDKFVPFGGQERFAYDPAQALQV